MRKKIVYAWIMKDKKKFFVVEDANGRFVGFYSGETKSFKRKNCYLKKIVVNVNSRRWHNG